MILLIIFVIVPDVLSKGNIHDCVMGKNNFLEILFIYSVTIEFLATQALAGTGDGTTSTSCAGCDPALDVCFPSCQGYIKNVYFDCDGVCLPEGYYFDPRKISSLNI